MKAFTRILALLSGVFLFTTQSHSQTDEIRSAFISSHIAGFIVTNKNFSDVYDSNRNFAFGAGFGYPLHGIVYFYGKITYFSSSGVPVRYHPFSDIPQKLNGSARYGQLTANAGLQFTAIDSNRNIFAIQGGLGYALIREKIRIVHESENTQTSTINRNTYGFFGGLAFNRKLNDSPISISIEMQYNLLYKRTVVEIENYSGVVLSLALHYHLFRV